MHTSSKENNICLYYKMSSNSSNEFQEGSGNTNDPSSSTKQISPAVRWCFTLNNYTEDDLSSIVPKFQEVCKVGFFSKEIGESGTPHLQGYVEFIKKCRPISHGLTERISWRKAKGNLKANFDYCSKDEDFFWSKGVPKGKVKLIKPNRVYQREVCRILEGEPDDRTIYWFWDSKGGVGKTSMCKYACIVYQAMILGGKAADIRNAICDYVKTNGFTPRNIVINIPRSFNSDFLSYEGLENIKDMCFYSGKYEGGMVVGNSPNLIVFANEPPDTTKCSMDRWCITEITPELCNVDNQELLKFV